MKKIVLSLLLLFGFYTVHSQHILSSADFTQDWRFAGNEKKIIRMDDSSFMLVKEQKDDTEFIKYTTQLEEIFKITVESSDYRPTVEFAQNRNTIVVILGEKEGKNDYKIKASLYNATDGSFIKSELLVENLRGFWPIQFSSNRDYFYVKNLPKDSRKEPREYHMFSSSSLEVLGKVNVMLQNKEKLLSQEITNQGELLWVTNPWNSKDLKFEIYAQNGSLKKRIVKGVALPGNGDLEDVIYKDQAANQGKLICTSEKRGALKAIEVWQLDFNALTAASLYKVDVDKDFVKGKIYRHVHPSISGESDPVLVKGYQKRGKAKLKAYTFQDAFIDEDGNVVTMFDQLTFKESSPGGGSSRTAYIFKAGNVMLMAFDPQGAYKWSNLIERKAFNMTNKSHTKMDNFYKPKWSGLRAVGHKHGDEISLISWEAKGLSSYYVAYRKIDWQTGEMKLVQPLIAEPMVNINTNYLTWLNSNQIVLLSLKGIGFALSKNEIKLQVVEEERR